MKNKKIIFGLGSNIDNRQSFLNEAVSNLTQELNLKNLKRSQIFKNPAMLLPDSPKEWDSEFLNIAISADIDLEKFPPEKILEIVKKIEIEVGRKNRGKWAPREIDIDILAIDNLYFDLGDKLTIPHKGLFERDFFLKTVEEIEGDLLKKIEGILPKKH